MSENSFRNSGFELARAFAAHGRRVTRKLGLERVIQSIQVEGLRNFNAHEVISITRLKNGEVYHDEGISSEVYQLKSTGLFSKVEISENNGHIVIKVSENPIIERVIYEGRYFRNFERLKSLLHVSENSMLWMPGILPDIQLLTVKLREIGVYDVSIMPKIVETSLGFADFIFEEEILQTSLEGGDTFALDDDFETTSPFPSFLSGNSDSFLKATISDYVLEPLSRALRMAEIPVSEHDVFIDDVISRIMERSSKEATLAPATVDATTNSTSVPLPDKAPSKWKDRDLGETAPAFARRIYGPWLKDGMSKRTLRRLDAALVNELNTWVREGNEMPSDIKLLTVGEENQRLLEAGPVAVREHLGKFTGAEAAREAERLRQAQARSR